MLKKTNFQGISAAPQEILAGASSGNILSAAINGLTDTLNGYYADFATAIEPNGLIFALSLGSVGVILGLILGFLASGGSLDAASSAAITVGFASYFDGLAFAIQNPQLNILGFAESLESLFG